MDLKPALDLIKEFEGFRANAYRDPVGIWTIGYGTILGVKKGDKVTEAEALKLLGLDVTRERLPAIKNMVKVNINNNELCALISFCYNVGVGALAKSTLMRKLNEGYKRVDVANEFLKWNKAGGRVLAGLKRRRLAERELFLKPEVVVKALT